MVLELVPRRDVITYCIILAFILLFCFCLSFCVLSKEQFPP